MRGEGLFVEKSNAILKKCAPDANERRSIGYGGFEPHEVRCGLDITWQPSESRDLDLGRIRWSCEPVDTLP